MLGILLVMIAFAGGLRSQNTAPVPTEFAILYGTTGSRQLTTVAGGYVRAYNITGATMQSVIYDTTGGGDIEVDSLLGGNDRRWFVTVDSSNIVNSTFRRVVLLYGDWGRTHNTRRTLYLTRALRQEIFDFPYAGLNVVFNPSDSADVGDRFIIGLLHSQFQ